MFKSKEKENLNKLLALADMAVTKLLDSPLSAIVDVDNINKDSYDVMDRVIDEANKDLRAANKKARHWEAECAFMKKAYESKEKANEVALAKVNSANRGIIDKMESTYKKTIENLEKENVKLSVIIDKRIIEAEAENQGDLLMGEVSILKDKLTVAEDEAKSHLTNYVSLMNAYKDLADSNASNVKDLVQSIEGVAKEVAKNSNPKIVLANAEIQTES